MAASLHVKYGVTWNIADPLQIELACIRQGGQWKDSYGQSCGAGLAKHIISAAKIIWPHIKWHRWLTDLLIPTFCLGGQTAVYGPSNSGKSFGAAVFGLTYYYAQPTGTTVLVSSTTREELELRVWGEIKSLHKRARERFPWLPGYLTESRQLISTDGKEEDDGRDIRDGVIGRPCRKGSEWVGLSSLVGIKNSRMVYIGDEFHFLPEGALKALANLTANPACTSILLGNLPDLNTPLGDAAEPENGWDSLLDSEVSRVYKTRWYNGRAVQLIGKDSPQLDFPEGAEPFAPLIGRRYLHQCEVNYGLDTPLYNMFAAGKIPRGTMENRVISKPVCLKFNAFEPVVWGHEQVTKLYSADISYTAEHGDRTAGRPFAFGTDSEGKLRFAPLERPKVYAPSDRKSSTIEDQIAEEMKSECERLGIPPSRCFFDGTGRSSFTSALMRIWSTQVVAIEFGGQATVRPNFIGRKYSEDRGHSQKKGDLLPCNEVFGKFVTELWFAFRYLVEADQARALDEETAKEFYLRLWKLTPGNKMDVEKKEDMKLRMGRSPDLADCYVTGLEGARRLGFVIGSIHAPRPRNTVWLQKLKREHQEALRKQELVAA